MGLQEQLSQALSDDLRTLARALDEAGKGEAGSLVSAFMARYGWSNPGRVYRHLKLVGWTSDRKRRADAGKTSLSDEAIAMLGAATRLGLRDNGKQTMEVANAISVLDRNGVEIPVQPARVRILLRRHHLDTQAAKQQKPHVAMRSLHPNHVHQVDPSLCLLYYTPNGQQHVLHDNEIHRNKPLWAEKLGNLKCWRYVLYDHRSAVLIVRYYAAKGETVANLYDFLCYAWARRTELGCPFHGVPSMLVWDKGSANSAAAIKNALNALQVQDWAHAQGHSWAKGGVENGNNLVEKNFESLLRFEPVRNLDELNAAAERWYVAFNANAIPRLESRIRRPHCEPIARYDLWLREIRQEHIRLLPDLETCRLLLTTEPETRKVGSTSAGGLTIQYRHPISKRTEYYDLNGIPGIVKTMKVEVSPLIYGNAQVMVWAEDYKGEKTRHILDPVGFDSAGQRRDAPVWGEEHRANRDTETEKAASSVLRLAYPGLDEKAIDKAKAKGQAPFGGSLTAHSNLSLVETPTYLPRRGVELTLPENPIAQSPSVSPASKSAPAAEPPRRSHTPRVLDATELCIELKRRLGPQWEPAMGAAIFSTYPSGAPESDLARLAEWLLTPTPQQPPQLRIVS